MKLPVISTRSAWMSVLKMVILREKLKLIKDSVNVKRVFSTYSTLWDTWKPQWTNVLKAV
jgi:hypothetical protein